MNRTDLHRCQYCTTLSISVLVDLAEKDFGGGDVFAEKEYFQHHRSIIDLEASAEAGCDFCAIILESCKITIAQSWNSLLSTTRPSHELILARKLKKSDIRLCLNSDHVYHSARLEDVKLWDKILIQIGDGDVEVESVHFSGISPRAKPISLLIKTTHRTVDFNGRRVGRLQTDADLGSDSNFATARSWLNECLEHHRPRDQKYETSPEQSEYQMPQLPTRVIEVENTDKGLRARIFTSNGNRAPYIALSHCWGGAIPQSLTSATLPAFEHDIPLDKMARNFMDTITVTQRLGYQYLWIDCLCILQDSKLDWAQESVRMGRIYRDATLTIFASMSERSSQGFLQGNTTKPRDSNTCTQLRISPETGSRCVSVFTNAGTSEGMIDLSLYGTLSQRGWTLQESIFSRRQLHYGKEFIYWQCNDSCKSSEDVPQGVNLPETEFESLRSALSSDLLQDRSLIDAERNELLVDYYRLVREYSKRRLTYANDKLVALSGLCERLHPVIGGDFVAGLWSCDLIRGLLWHCDLDASGHIKPYRAPSWSWASTDGIVICLTDDLVRRETDLKVVNVHVQLKTTRNPYGEVQSGILFTMGFVMPFIRSDQTATTSKRTKENVGVVYFDDRLAENLSAVYHVPTATGARVLLSLIDGIESRTNWEFDASMCTHGRHIALLAHTRKEEPEAKELERIALILRHVAHEDDATYERVGLAVLFDDEDELSDDWKLGAVKII